MYLDMYIIICKQHLCFSSQLAELFLKHLFIERAFDSTGLLHALSVYALLMNPSSSNFCSSYTGRRVYCLIKMVVRFWYLK